MSMFNLSLLLDKSTLQSLSYSSFDILERHYLLVLPPILILEIMGDLYSETNKIRTEGAALNTRLVQILAQKLRTNSAVRNVHRADLCRSELLGYDRVELVFKPWISPTKLGDTGDGGVGAIVDNEVEMEMIHRWQDGKFTDEDGQYAQQFREKYRNIDLNTFREEINKGPIPFAGKTLRELAEHIESVVLSYDDQWTFISWYCNRLKISTELQSQICARFLFSSGNFKQFAPYTFYCFLVENVLIWGLGKGLIPSSKNDKAHLDIEYAYYFPFVRVFSSNDKLHKQCWDVFGNVQQQIFMPGNTLGQDMQLLESHYREIGEEEQRRLRDMRPYPPVVQASATFQAFEKMQEIGALMRREEFEGNTAGYRTEEEEKALVDHVMKTYNRIKNSE